MSDLISRNASVHNNLSHKYEQLHTEIFNSIEQRRISGCIEKAVSCIKTCSSSYTALDYGCGSGNITNHLVRSGLSVVSADISDKFLKMIQGKYLQNSRVRLLKINGIDLNGIKDNSFDLAAAYSVLHHVPDYLALVKELLRVTRPGGIIYLDHEHSDSFWSGSKVYSDFLIEARKKSRFDFMKFLHKYSTPSNYYYAIRRLINPRYQSEGDLHVWADDRIEWEKIEYLLKSDSCETIFAYDYLLYRGYPIDVYNRYRDLCADYRIFVGRKRIQL